MRFAAKLTSAVTLVAIVVVPVLGYTVFYLTRNIVQQNITANQLQETQSIFHNIDRSMYDAYQGIELISKGPQLESFVKSLDLSAKFLPESFNRNQHLDDLKNKVELTGPWEQFSVIDIQGNIVYSSQLGITGKSVKQYSALSAAHFTAVTGQRYYSDLLVSEFTDRPTVLFASSIRDRNSRRILGTVVGHLAWPIVLQTLDKTHSAHQIFLFNRDGLVIATPSELKDDILKTNLSQLKQVQQLFNGERKSSGIASLDDKTGTVLATAISQEGYLGYRGSDWGLLLGVPTQIAYASVVDLARNITIIILIVMVILIGIIYLLAERIARPIEILKNAALAIGKGDTDAVISIETGDELEELGMAFNEMAITRASAEAELVKQGRLAVLGQLTATVSHELRNPLGTINNCLIYLKRYNKDDNAVVKESVENALNNVQRCNNIISDLLNYTRQQPLEFIPTDLDKWLASLLDEYDHAPGIVLNRQLQGGVKIDIDVEHLRRAIINILDNACQAILPADGQGIIVETEKQLTVATSVNNDEFEISISDTGAGIKAEDLPYIFEPFYSKKTFGTGLGLPTVEKITQQHGGRINVESELDQGTRVTLRLPLKANKLQTTV